jgi:hypothetical protein
MFFSQEAAGNPRYFWGKSRTTDSPGADKSPDFLIRLTPRPAACALSAHNRKAMSAAGLPVCAEGVRPLCDL